MRLLNTSTYAVTEDNRVAELQRYAILSHRWRQDEISLYDIKTAELRDSHKVFRACVKARDQGLEWLWIDTCCIDKTNALETAAAINSMFQWYRQATVCYSYIDDIAKSPSVPRQQMFDRQQPEKPGQKSEWFERGWTLQELLAPRSMEFYDRNWELLGTKQDMADILEAVTGINRQYLNGEADFRDASIAARMSWMAGRCTTKAEDVAYSMIGILDVNLPIQYGEGVKAFMGLQRALMEVSTDETIFAWTRPDGGLQCYRGNRATDSRYKWAESEWGLLAPSPDCFHDSGDLVMPPPERLVTRPGGGYRWTQQGMQFQMSIAAGGEARTFFGQRRKEVSLVLNCWRPNPHGKPLTVCLKLSKRGEAYTRVQLDRLDTKMGAKPDNNSRFGADQLLTVPLTITQPMFRL